MMENNNESLLDIQIVKATLENEIDVIRASEDVYAGLDYLPSLYKKWIEEGDREDPRRFNFVVLLDSEVAGFFSLLFSQDQGKFLSSAQRVAKNHRSKGIGKKITEFTANFARSVNKDVEQLISFTDAWLGGESLEKKIKNEGGALVHLTCPLLNFQPKFVQNLTVCQTKLEIAKDNENFLQSILTAPWSSLLPNSFLHVNWDPYCPSSKEDVDYILTKRPTVVRGEDSFSVFSNPVDIPAGKRIGLDIFANSVEKFLDHVMFQLRNFAEDKDPEEIFKLFIFTPCGWTEAMLDLLRKTMQIPKENFLSLGTVDREYPSMYICKKIP